MHWVFLFLIHLYIPFEQGNNAKGTVSGKTKLLVVGVNGQVKEGRDFVKALKYVQLNKIEILNDTSFLLLFHPALGAFLELSQSSLELTSHTVKSPSISRDELEILYDTIPMVTVYEGSSQDLKFIFPMCNPCFQSGHELEIMYANGTRHDSVWVEFQNVKAETFLKTQGRNQILVMPSDSGYQGPFVATLNSNLVKEVDVIGFNNSMFDVPDINGRAMNLSKAFALESNHYIELADKYYRLAASSSAPFLYHELYDKFLQRQKYYEELSIR